MWVRIRNNGGESVAFPFFFLLTSGPCQHSNIPALSKIVEPPIVTLCRAIRLRMANTDGCNPPLTEMKRSAFKTTETLQE